MFTIFVCSRLREQTKKMEKQLIQKAAEVFHKATNLEVEILDVQDRKLPFDGYFIITKGKQNIKLPIEIKKNLRTVNIFPLNGKKETYTNLLVITDVI